MSSQTSNVTILIPPVQRLGNAVLLQGPAILDAHYLVALGIRETARRDGIRASPRLQRIAEALASAAADIRDASGIGHEDVPDSTDLENSNPLDRISTFEAASILGIGARHTCRLAGVIGGRKGPGNAYTFDRAAVEAHAHRRKMEIAA
jgi:hypothetical protein